MREALASVLAGLSSLQEDDYRERPVDRLHALASAQIRSANRTARESHLASLGVSFIALKAANRPDELARAVEKLAAFLERCKPGVGKEMRERIARQAIMENVIDFCPTCKGTGEVPAHDGVDGAQRMKECPECGGHGRRRYSDSERLEAIQADKSDADKISRQLAYALSVLAEAEHEAIRGAKQLLERW